ncbi:N-acetylmuramoyl-L-alanine amidase [Sphingobacterium shayense]|uniref:N-acetylmuramoyl-L-alanine amidase n=1 Tax=Sphingobacterium shayense TaxID=626343 RepID=UPI001555793F|nr:N-acetylmuramoyl-L-alanine amidase [Sphingobacterium shayense]NQD71986.1 N-acetylmuramoyl-L-alanine amidase [Sphingobacterium shayense]
MRKIRRIVLHCTSGWPDQTTQSILDFWRKNLGWKQVGYHRLISADGKIENLAGFSEITNGVQGYNSDSIHICYKGGLIKTYKDTSGKTQYVYGDTRTSQQKKSIEEAISNALWELHDSGQDMSDITIVGHRDLSTDLNGNERIEEREWVKVCPTFDAIKEYGAMVGDKATERYKKRSTY